jgi:hypothetical protein
MSTSSEDDTDSTESHGEYDSELAPDVDMCMEDDVDAPDGFDLDGDVDMKRDGEDDEEEDEEKEDEEEVEDQDEDDGKEPQMLGQGEMVNTSADDVHTRVDNQAFMLPEQCQEMYEQTQQPQPLAPARWPQTPEPRPQTRTPETHPLSGLEYLGLVTPEKPRPAVPTMRKAEAAGNTSYVDMDVDVDQQVVTVSPMSLSAMSLSLMSLSPMSHSLSRAWMAWLARSEPVLALHRRRWLLHLG